MRAGAEALAAHIQLEDARPDEAVATARRVFGLAERLDLVQPAYRALEVLDRVARVHDLHAVELALTRRMKVVTKNDLRLGVVRACRELGTMETLANESRTHAIHR